MEEVDNIIIETLKNLNCDIDDEVQGLKHFTAEMVTTCIVACLECIVPEMKLSRKLPPSMSLRLKIATNLAEHIKKLGYRGDMGYQTILYCNEVDIRRVFMFLIEHLPKETNKAVANEDAGYVPKLVKQIEKHLQVALDKPWVPVNILKNGIRDYGDVQIKHTFGLSIPLRTVNLEVPSTHKEVSDGLRHYWIHNLPVITRQCDSSSLIPSLLFKDNEYVYYEEDSSIVKLPDADINLNSLNIENNLKTIEISKEIERNIKATEAPSVSTNNNKAEMLTAEIELQKNKLNTILQTQMQKQLKLSQLIEQINNEEKTLSEVVTTIKVKSKALNVLAKDENMEKLRNLVESGNDRLIDLANQWNDVQSPLLEQYRSLQRSLSSQELKVQEDQDKFNKVQEKLRMATKELKEKEHLEQQLAEEHSRINKNTNRSVYTRKILEIIGNIKKQDEEIKKILKDTKEVQKDINNLNGQLDRSFALADELIFRDAKQDEMARKAYKLVAGLHNDCNEIVQAITNLGMVEREARNLQEQVDNEISKEYGTKLERVNRDLQEIRKELATLMHEHS